MAYYTETMNETIIAQSRSQVLPALALGATLGACIGLIITSTTPSVASMNYVQTISPGATRAPSVVLRSSTQNEVPPILEVTQRAPQFVSRRGAILGGAVAAGMATGGVPSAWAARKTGVNKPELLPEGPVVNVIDTLGTFTKSQYRDLNRDIDSIERLFGVKVRVLTQNYPNTPGLAIVDYWGVDDNTMVIVVDDTFPNLLNFNVGTNVDLLAPNSRFFAMLTSKYGTKKFVRDNGEDEAVLRCVNDILDGLTRSDETGASMLLD